MILNPNNADVNSRGRKRSNATIYLWMKPNQHKKTTFII
jgi:hypothetical protein